MAITLDIKSELPKAIKWTNEHTKQLPFSISQAMNASVKGLAAVPGSKQKSAINGLAGSSKRFFDRPKPATSTGFFATTANKRTLSLVIKPKDKPWDRNRYLSGNIFGGARPPKPFEIAFAAQSKGQIPTGARFVPTGAIKQDRYGNVSKSNLRKILNGVGTGSNTGNNIFIGKPTGGGRQLGVYRRERKFKLRPLFFVESSVDYSARFPAVRIIESKVKSTFGLYLRTQLARNVAANVKAGRADMRTGLL